MINDEAGMTRDETFAFAKEFGLSALELRSAQKPKLEYVEALPDAELKGLGRQLADRGLKRLCSTAVCSRSRFREQSPS